VGKSEKPLIARLYGAVAALHVCAGALLLYYGLHHPALIGIGVAAYMLGLRHAFDADHIAAIDDSVRYRYRCCSRPACH
jgi:high-affinity nickel-transport protein